MNNLYIARQPIFEKQMRLFGYELLYRRSQKNFFEETDDDLATAALLDNSFLYGFCDLIDNSRGFVNFPKQLLLNDTPTLLPKENTVIEILERVQVDDAVVRACKRFKDQGYTLALDDFIFEEEKAGYKPLLELVDIIKIEYSADTANRQKKLIDKYGHRITFLAERLETAEEFKHAVEIGHKLMQGFFFSRPLMVNVREIGSLDINLTLILEELHRPEPDFKAIAGLFEKDLGLAYKLLRMANSVFYGVKYHISSIHQALMRVGTQALIRWTNLMMIKGLHNADNAELVKTSLIRGKVLALLALETGQQKRESDFFITGILSSVDVLLNESITSIVDRLPLSEEIKDALLGEDNALRRALAAVLDFEKAEWEAMDDFLFDMRMSRARFMTLYLEAIKWQGALAA